MKKTLLALAVPLGVSAIALTMVAAPPPPKSPDAQTTKGAAPEEAVPAHRPRRSVLANVQVPLAKASTLRSSAFEPLVQAEDDEAFFAHVARLREDDAQRRATHEALRALDESGLASTPARMAIFALGRAGHPASAEPLAEIIARPLPDKSHAAHPSSAYAEGAITRGMALEALESVAVDEAAAATLRQTLDGVFDRRDSHHLVATAAHIAKRHFNEPETQQAQLEARLGEELAHLARLQLRTTLPPTEGDPKGATP